MKLQYFEDLKRSASSLEKTLMLGETEGRRRRGRRRARRVDSIANSIDTSLSKLQKVGKDREPGVLRPQGHKESDRTENGTKLSHVTQQDNMKYHLPKLPQISKITHLSHSIDKHNKILLL